LIPAANGTQNLQAARAETILIQIQTSNPAEVQPILTVKLGMK